MLGFKRVLLIWALPLLLLPGAGKAQLRSVVSSEIAVSSREAALRLDFQDGEPLSMALRAGDVLVDGKTVGSYTRGDAVDSAWRSLLGQVISLDDGPLARALSDWNPPEDLTGSAAEVAEALDRALETALTLPEVARDTAEGQETSLSLSLSDEDSLIGALLRRTGALEGLAEALHEASIDHFLLKIGEDVKVERGETLDRSLIVVDGDLDLRGTVQGDVVVSNGTVRLREGSRVTGDLRVADGRLESLGGEVEGSILDLGMAGSAEMSQEELEELREELKRDIRRDILSSMEREGRSRSTPFFGIFGNLGRAIAGLLENLATFLVLVILGVLTVHFGGNRLEVIATTVRRAPAQSGMVGLAGGFLLIPAWILGIVALAVSIIGIPLLLAWIPLFPLAAGLAAFLGYVAVARNVGEWVADQEYRGLEWIRGSNTFYVLVAGLAALMVPAVAASLVRIIGFGFLQGLLTFVGGAIGFVAVAVGFGAVLLTRGGKIRPYAAYYDFEEEVWTEDEAPASPGDPFRDDPTASPGDPFRDDPTASQPRPGGEGKTAAADSPRSEAGGGSESEAGTESEVRSEKTDHEKKEDNPHA
ncbi:MAG: hypothetical protein ACQET1_01525 [Gemmatimonadota bacterium]